MTEKKTGSIEHILVHFRWLEPWHSFCICPSKNFDTLHSITLPSSVVKKQIQKNTPDFFEKAHLKKPNKTYQKNTLYFSFEISTKYKIKQAGHSYSYL